MPSSSAVKKPKPRPKKPANKTKKVKKLSGGQPPKVLVRTSERSSWKTCRWMWDRNYGLRLRPIRESPALRFGTLIHSALEERYPKGIKRGPHPARAFEKLYAADLKEAEREWGTFADDEWVNALELGVDMMEGYVDKYGKDEEWEVIASEMTFQVPVYLPPGFNHPLLPLLFDPDKKLDREILEGKKPLFWYVGTMDGVWKNRMDKGIRINDYKTTKNDPQKEGLGKLKLDEQTTAYWTWGTDCLINEKVLGPRQVQALDGMVFTFLKKSKGDTREQDADGMYLNLDGSVSKKQPTPRYHRELVYRSESEREKARVRAVEEVLEMMATRAGILNPYKNPKTGQTGHCEWCPQRDVCELHEAGADWETLSDVTMTEWDPYDSHEIKWAENR